MGPIIQKAPTPGQTGQPAQIPQSRLLPTDLTARHLNPADPAVRKGDPMGPAKPAGPVLPEARGQAKARDHRNPPARMKAKGLLNLPGRAKVQEQAKV